MKYKLIIFLEKWRTIILVGGVRDARRWRRCASALLVGKLFMTSKSVTLNHGEPRPVSSAVPGLLTKLSFYQSVTMTLSSPSHQDAHICRARRPDGLMPPSYINRHSYRKSSLFKRDLSNGACTARCQRFVFVELKLMPFITTSR